MPTENAIEVTDVTKTFRVYLDKGNTLKEKVLFSKRRRYEERRVLQGISFSVKKGEAVGLIGHNGCGKSTTLKLLTKIIYPDSGTITMNGRVSSLIELGAGFHPDMSGRENIYINASIFGLKKKEIDARLDDIIAFSELEQFIDNPVRTYSSGMYMRLAFSVAINVDADILLIDEILAVGDASFQAKCFNRMREIKANGTTIILVSHSLGQIEQICDRSIWLHEGHIREEGDPSEVDFKYLEFMGEKTNKKNQTKNEKKQDESDQNNTDDQQETEKNKVEIMAARLLGQDGNELQSIRVGSPVTLEIEYKKNQDVADPILGLKIYRNDNVIAYGTNTLIEKMKLQLKDNGRIICHFPKWQLLTGHFFIDIAIREADMLVVDYKTKIVSVETYSPTSENGVTRMEHEWQSLG